MKVKVIQIFFTVLFIFLWGCFFYLQIIKGDFYRKLSSRNSIRLINIPASRGNIYDRNSKLVASNRLSFGVFVVPQEANDIDTEIGIISKISALPHSVLERNYNRNRRAPFAPCELARDIPKHTAMLIEETKPRLPGVLVKEIPERDYLYKDIFCHVVGYIGEIDDIELQLLKPYGYNIKDLIGKDGLERYCDNVLRGKNGGMQIQVDNMGRQVKVLSFKRPKKGKDIVLTIDARLQRVVWNLMRDKKGAAVFMNPHNGEVLSLVSSPSFDPNESLGRLLRDKDSPLLNRAVKGLYSPGSIFKVVVSLAGLETGKITSETTFVCKGKLNIGNAEFECWNKDGHGAVDLRDALMQSCNVYFYNLGLILGVDVISEYARHFGFGKPAGIELYGEGKGFVPSKPWKKSVKKEVWFPGDTANLAIGQGYLLVTPLQIACMISAVANGGIVIQPHLLKAVGDVDNVHKGNPAKLNVNDENLEAVKRGMYAVVNDDGTGKRAFSENISISAKTGTVQVVPGLISHGWFAGFAPSKNPEISFVVFVENCGSGGDIPAEIAKTAVEYWNTIR